MDQSKKIHKIAVHAQNIRELFSWNQDEFAQRLGVSRPTVANAEKDPDKLSRTVTLAMYLITTAELKHRRSVIKRVKEHNRRDKNEWEDIFNQLKSWGSNVPSWITSSGKDLAKSIEHRFSNAEMYQTGKKAVEETLGNLIRKIKAKAVVRDDDDLQEILVFQAELLDKIEEKLTEYYDTLDPVEFVRSLD